MLDEARCRTIIAEAFPQMELHSVRYFSAGWDCELWEVNDELLFRFPLRPECAEPLRVEARLLSALQRHLSGGVPVPEHVSEGCESFPFPFFAYQKLPGVPLAEMALDEQAELSISERAGLFVRELHSFPIQRAAALGVPAYTPESWRAWYAELHEQVRALAARHLPEDLAAGAESFWRGFLGDEAFFRFEPTLIHRDFGFAHMLVTDGRLTGVIDFADACVGDPALDFAGCDGAFRERMLTAYGCSANEAAGLSARADVYRRKISPFHAIVYGIEIDDAQWVRQGVEAIRARIVAG